MSKKMSPHRAVLKVDMSVHEIMRTGECHGDALPVKELEKCGLRKHFLLYVDGKDRYDCLNNVLKKIKKLEGKQDGET